MRKAVLDTDTLSYVYKANDPNFDATARQYLRVFRRFTVSAISIAEIVEGFEKTNDSVRLRHFLDLTEDYEVLPVGFEEAVLAGRILGALAREGEKIGDPAHYAAHAERARQTGARLYADAALKVAHFEMIEKLLAGGAPAPP